MSINISNFYGKDLYATSTVIAYKLPDISSAVLKNFYSDNYIGNIYSSNNDQWGNHFFMIYPDNDLSQQPFYVLIDPYSLKISGMDLTDIDYIIPDVKPVDTTPPFTIGQGLSDLFAGVTKYLPYILIGGAVIIFLPSILKIVDEKRK